MDKGVILYPCYFDSDLTRTEGRRVPRSKGVQNPEPVAIERILKKQKIPYNREQKSHPSYWWKGQGRFVAEFTGTKGELINIVSMGLKSPE
ncbi:signal recognition particle subunit SRP19/SEC65 family protein [Methanospirillum stamsii]|uniref:Signal recognition particle 19 kDa protein n=1 Tax=Methanospirillum stamsii TaxID=1277351 RepID=A0A2V2MUK5_9EURY|nr:signal recognition particle subunit SRP19/SEC65 family protein [Methanospirillum stamsii]PWR71059.1 signal recognition particle protein Srp19 [Methanospirillum stamsii]